MMKRVVLFLTMVLIMLCGAEENALDLLASKSLTNAKGKEIPVLKALEGKKFIGLYFSAHWCGPCRMFTPELVKFYSHCQSKGFEVIFVSSDKSADEMANYMKETGMKWLAIPFEDAETRNGIKTLFGVNGIPHLIILDAQGKLVSSNARWDVAMLGNKALKQWSSPDYTPLTYEDYQKNTLERNTSKSERKSKRKEKKNRKNANNDDD